jgi:hypothetical protein
MNPEKLDVWPDDPLFRIERRIAQRADELSKSVGLQQAHARDLWQQAEREVWESANVIPASAVADEVTVASDVTMT